MEKQFKTVGTHSGKFHADEIMATAILGELFDLKVVRTREAEILNKLDIVYDVGGGEFDHHNVEKEYRESGTPYAACGLIWRKFGRDVITAVDPGLEQEDVDSIFHYMDAYVIEGIDASDNGFRTYETIIPTMCISTIISKFNPPWGSQVTENEAFNEAVGFASAVLKNTINQQTSEIRARSYVIEAYNRRIRPEILVLDGNYPWANTVSEIDEDKEVLFVIYPRDEQFMIQTVRDNGGGFNDRKKLPEAWAGKREEELGRIVGVNDAVFCHPSRFIAGAGSLESILKMADMAIAEPVPERREEQEIPRGFILAIKRFLTNKQVVIKRK